MSVLVRVGKDTASWKARENGHRMRPWVNEGSHCWSACVVCGAGSQVVRATGSISGPALVNRCKVPEPAAGRAA